MSIKPDWWIREQAQKGMIDPFEDRLVRQGVVSYGLTSFGYDLRAAPEWKIFTNAWGAIVDPKDFSPKSFVEHEGDTVIIPPNSFVLARSVEYIRMPETALAIAVGKSTYARCFSGDTRVALVDGHSLTLEEMANAENEVFFGYSLGAMGQVMVTMLENPRFIGRDSLLEITLDNGQTIQATPDHLFFARDGQTIQANDLRPGTSLMPLYRSLRRGYEMVYQPGDNFVEPTKDLVGGARVFDFGRVRESLKGQKVNHKLAVQGRTPRSALAINEDFINSSDIDPPIRGVQVHTLTLSSFHASKARGVLQHKEPTLRSEVNASKILHAPQMLNHKVVSIKHLKGEHDTYCLTVPEAGNFALEAGVFVHNCGVVANVTPIEPGWEGHVTLEFSNTTPLPAKMYANEGVVQLVFFEGERPEVTYSDRKGKYQGQRGITLPKL
jgi:deoxycytidine triphosphate deaminase